MFVRAYVGMHASMQCVFVIQTSSTLIATHNCQMYSRLPFTPPVVILMFFPQHVIAGLRRANMQLLVEYM